MLLKTIKPIMEKKNLIPTHQSVLRNKHLMIDQDDSITNFIENAYEEKQTCSIIFVYVAQAFDTVSYAELIKKLRKMLSRQYVDIPI